MRCLVSIIVFTFITSTTFADEKRFLCKTEHFLDSSVVFGINKKEKEFETRQLKREFVLEISEENIFLTDVFPDKNSQESYTIIMRVTNTKDIMAVTVNPLVVQTLVFNPVKKIGTKTFQGSFLTYVSYIKCM